MASMKTLSSLLIAVGAAALVGLPLFAQTSETSPSPSPTITLSPSGLTSPGMVSSPSVNSTPSSTSSAPTAAGQPNDAEMMKQMMELSKLNENHKLLTDLNGTWSYTVTMW